MRVLLTLLFIVPWGAVAQTSQDYAGSTACKACHPAVYKRWSKTRMANVVRDPRSHPEAIIPDLSKPNPLVTFTKDDIAFVYGSRWKQRAVESHDAPREHLGPRALVDQGSCYVLPFDKCVDIPVLVR